MQMFKDTSGKEWSLQVNVGALDRVKTLTGIDFLVVDDIDNSLMPRLLNDPATIGNVAYAVIQPQAQEAGVTRDAFLAALGPAQVKIIRDALLQELPDFFLDEDQRQGMLALIQTKKRIYKRGFKGLAKDLVNLSDEEMEQAVQLAAESQTGSEQPSGPPSTDAPAS